MSRYLLHFKFVFIFIILLSFNLASAQEIKVIAKKGEGVFSLLRRNGLEPALYLSQFFQLNAKILGEDSLLFEGQSYFLPDADEATLKDIADLKTSPLIVPVFGKKYEKLIPKDSILKGSVYYLLAGHGGPDPGAIGDYGPYKLSEDEYAYDVTIRLARNLMERGALVHLIIKDDNDGIRDDAILALDIDEVTYLNQEIPYNHKERLQQRTDLVNDLYIKNKGKYQRLLSIHLDSRSRGKNIDVFFYHHHRSRSGEHLADQIHQTFKRKYAEHQPGRSYEGTVSARSGLYVVKHTHPPTVFIELGNIKNARDQRRFVLSNNRQALANWISEGIVEDYLLQNNKK